jgi:hypothetical protein
MNKDNRVLCHDWAGFLVKNYREVTPFLYKLIECGFFLFSTAYQHKISLKQAEVYIKQLLLKDYAWITSHSSVNKI